MQRSSTMKDGTVIGHVLVPIAGRIWDFVGRLPSSGAAEKKGFHAWAAEECPAAHRVQADLPLANAGVLYAQGVAGSKPEVREGVHLAK